MSIHYDYTIYLTDPLSGSFVIKPYTTNGTIFPTAEKLFISEGFIGATTRANSSLLLYGKGAPNYGSRIQENLIQVLENFSGATRPAIPLIGQLWYERKMYFKGTTGEWFRWNDINDIWELIPVGGSDALEYYFNSNTNVLRKSMANAHESHPLAVLTPEDWIIREFTNGTTPAPVTMTTPPPSFLKVWTGKLWREVNTIQSPITEPTGAIIGDVWYDTTTKQLKIFDGTDFTSTAERYLLLDGTAPMTGSLNLGNNTITNVADPTADSHAMPRSYADLRFLDIGSTVAVDTAKAYTDVEIAKVDELREMFDLDLTSITDNQFLSYDSTIPNNSGTGTGGWKTGLLKLTSITDSAGTLFISSSIKVGDINQLSGILNTSTIQTQLNTKFETVGGTLTGNLFLPSDASPTLSQAVTRKYVDSVAGAAIDGVIITGLNWKEGSGGSGQLGVLDIEINNEVAYTTNIPHEHNLTFNSTQISHTVVSSVMKNVTPISPSSISGIMETQFDHVNNALSPLLSPFGREIFIVKPDYEYFSGIYIIKSFALTAGTNRLNVYVNGVKQIASQQAMQQIVFGGGINTQTITLSTRLLLGAATFGIIIRIDGNPRTLEYSSAEITTMEDFVTELNVSSELNNYGFTALWVQDQTSIYIYSDAVGAGSSIQISEPATSILSEIRSKLNATVRIFPDNDSVTTNITENYSYYEVGDSFSQEGEPLPAKAGSISNQIRFLVTQYPTPVGVGAIHGGYPNASGSPKTEKWVFSTRTWYPTTSMLARTGHAATGGGDYGLYRTGQAYDPALTFSERYYLARETTKYHWTDDSTSSGTELTSDRFREDGAGCGNATFGIFGHGTTGSSEATTVAFIDRYAYAIDVSTSGTDLATRKINGGAMGNAYFGVFAGGWLNSYSGYTDKYFYSGDASIPTASLSIAVILMFSAANSSVGIFAGGRDGTYFSYPTITTNINEYTFATDSMNTGTFLDNARYDGASFGNEQYIIMAGGIWQEPGSTSQYNRRITDTTARYDYSTKTQLVSVGLSAPWTGAAGASDSHGGLTEAVTGGFPFLGSTIELINPPV